MGSKSSLKQERYLTVKFTVTQVPFWNAANPAVSNPLQVVPLWYMQLFSNNRWYFNRNIILAFDRKRDCFIWQKVHAKDQVRGHSDLCTVFLQQAAVHRIVFCKRRAICMECFQQRRVKRLRANARIKRRIPCCVAIRALINQPNIKRFPLSVYTELAWTKKCFLLFALLAISPYERRREIFDFPHNMLHYTMPPVFLFRWNCSMGTKQTKPNVYFIRKDKKGAGTHSSYQPSIMVCVLF